MNNTAFKTVIAYSTKADGSMKKDDGSIDLHDIQKFLKSQHLPEKVYAMDQVHGKNVGIISFKSEPITPETDAIITNEKGVSLAVVTADCLPILFYDPKAQAAGVVHAGSKGLLKQVIASVLNKFTSAYKSRPEDIIVTIGPSIEVSCYEVGKEYMRQFEELSWFDETFYREIKGKYYLDLRKIALQSLQKEGILKEHISVSDICTKCATDTYYSYRRGDKTERFVSTISII